MPDNIALLVGLILVGLFVLAELCKLWHARREQAECNRNVAIRDAIKDGRYAEFPVRGVYNILAWMVADLGEEISVESNILLEDQNSKGCLGSSTMPRLNARKTFPEIFARMEGLSFETEIATFAFLLQAMARQVRALLQGKGYRSSGAYLALLCDVSDDVKNGVRKFEFASTSDAIGLLCGIYNGVQSELSQTRRKLGIPRDADGVPLRKRGRPRKDADA